MTIDASIPLRNLIIDMDGVLWRGETPMPGLVAFFDALRACDIRFVLATNNATRLASQYAAKLQRFGVDVSPQVILTSSEATASYLSHRFVPGTSVYVVGETGLRQAMQQKDFRVINDDQDDSFVGPSVQADLVVVGFTRHACYPQLASAAYLVNNGALFVGTNPDVTFPHEVGPLPGAGSFLAFIEAATNREPLVVGKPGRAIFDEALARLGGSPDDTAMVGDRLETDIVGAQAAGLHTILLLSGVTTLQKLAESPIEPDLVLENIQALTEHLTLRQGYSLDQHDV